jgi:hypothetical protein
MNLKGNRIRALKGFIYNDLIDSKKLYIIAAAIIFGNVVLSAVINAIMSGTSIESSNGGGAIATGFFTAVICMTISGIVMAGAKKRREVFAFPMDRLTYTAGTLITFYINTVIVVLITSFAYLFEVLFYKLMSVINENIIYVNIVTLGAFLEGLIMSVLYLVLISTIAYFISILIVKFKAVAIITLGIIVGLLIILGFGVMGPVLKDTIMFLIGEQSPLLLSLKITLLTVLFQYLSYLTIGRLEVNS